ncbi:MAG: glycosyltransferase family 4 protein, partial [Myxococcota bacterium]
LEARGAPPERIHVIRRGTDVSFFEPVRRAGGDRGEANELRLVMVGRLVKKKGHITALKALAALGARGIAARLRIVGEGGEKASLLQGAKELGVADRIEFFGKTDRRGVREQLHWADIFLQCSVTTAEGDREGIPNVVVEAAATGLPVIGTRHGGIPETMDEGRTGLLVDEADVQGLEAALVELAGDPERRQQMGGDAAAFVREHLDERRQIQAHLDLYEALARDEIAACKAPEADLPEILQAALGYDRSGRDHRTLSAAEAMFRLMGRAPDAAEVVVPPEGPRNPTPPKASKLRRSFDALPEPVQDMARTTAHRIAPQWIERRREAHYRWVAARQKRFDDAIWARAIRGMRVEPFARERSTHLLETLLREVTEAKHGPGAELRSLAPPA